MELCFIVLFCFQLAALFGLLWLHTSNCPSQELTASSAPPLASPWWLVAPEASPGANWELSVCFIAKKSYIQIIISSLLLCSCLLVYLPCALWADVGCSFRIDPALHHQPASTIDTWSAGAAHFLRWHHHCQCIFYLPRWTQK